MSELTIHERLEIQMEYAVPLLRDLQEVLGTDVIVDALRQRLVNQQDRARAERTPAPVLSEHAVRLQTGFERFAEGGALEFEMVERSDDQVAIDVTACGYAEMMERLDATDLGPLLLCGADYAGALRAGTELHRSQTRMEGATHCDFRFRIDPEHAAPPD